jgi:hypothetical protein
VCLKSIFTKIVFFVIKEMKSQAEIRKKWITELSDYNKRDLHG